MSLPKENTVCFNIKVAWHSIHRMYNQQAAEHGLTTSIGFLLLNIDSKNGTPVTRIGPLLGLEPRSLSRMIKSLEEKGLIVRKADANDKRVVKIFLTELGKEKKEISKRTVKKFNQAVKQKVSEKKLDVFFEVIHDINQIIEKNQVFK
jgi:DNA-binding MarR family transcriptional regulator